ncbi:MAG: hypothetical protein IT425_12095 [Pirellulales bacterium]|nr:hypothetical protein [Pirellulales bacterium]
MSSFYCPHLDIDQDWCDRINDLCVPGRPGCVLCKNSVFAVPWQERLEEKRNNIEAKQQEIETKQQAKDIKD